jgi:hypothetical protein
MKAMWVHPEEEEGGGGQPGMRTVGKHTLKISNRQHTFGRLFVSMSKQFKLKILCPRGN